MKLLFLLFLEEDEQTVTRMLAELDVTAFSRVLLEGHGGGKPGWYGEISPQRSRMIFTLIPVEKASALMEAVAQASDVRDGSHPIHAIQVDVEAVARSRIPTPRADA